MRKVGVGIRITKKIKNNDSVPINKLLSMATMRPCCAYKKLTCGWAIISTIGKRIDGDVVSCRGNMDDSWFALDENIVGVLSKTGVLPCCGPQLYSSAPGERIWVGRKNRK